jgi:SAM-dependent methyltransferase
MAHAFNIRLSDPRVHAYAQRYCFLNGPDLELNARLREAVIACTRRLPEERDANRIEFLSTEKQRAIEAELVETLRVPASIGVTEVTRRDWIKNLGWKVARVPLDARSVLVLGSATCREAIFLRHRLPHARIVCTDFEDARLPNIERALDVEFHAGDFNELLAQHAGAFDVVFSNHVLEHLFDPDETLRLAKRALSPQGRMIAALPLDGQPNAPFSSVLDTAQLHPLDMCTVDVGHAWKTNVSAVLSALTAAGFTHAEFSSRESAYSVAERRFANRNAFERRAKLGLALNRAVFGAVRSGLKRIFPRDVPPLVLKTVFGIEHRVWFGSNRLKNEFSLECLVVAR